VPLEEVLAPIGVRLVEGEVAGLDLSNQTVQATTAQGSQTFSYDRLVFALGSQLNLPDIPGLAQHAFDVDTYSGAARLNHHLHRLPTLTASPGQFTVLIVGAGLTGIETACELPGRLRTILSDAKGARSFRVILADQSSKVGSDMGDSARPVIEEALAALDVETRMGVDIVAVSDTGVTLHSGEVIPAGAVIWCAGMRANPLTRVFPVVHDRLGRVPVDEYLRVKGRQRFRGGRFRLGNDGRPA
jgi:NADH dehydrogenase